MEHSIGIALLSGLGSNLEKNRKENRKAHLRQSIVFLKCLDDSNDSPRMPVVIGGLKCNALMDLGATQCFIGEDFLSETHCKPEYVQEPPRNIKVHAVGNILKPVGQVTLCIQWGGDQMTPMTFYIFPAKTCGLIIGHNFLRRVGLLPDAHAGEFRCKFIPNLIIPYAPDGSSPVEPKVNSLLMNTELKLDLPDWDATLVDGSNCDPQQRQMLREVLAEVKAVFSEKPGCTHLTTHRIRLKEGSKILKNPYRQHNPQKKSIMLRLVEELEELDFKWGDEQEVAFNKVKDALCKDVVLTMPDLTKPFVILTDASHVGLGATRKSEATGYTPLLLNTGRTVPLPFDPRVVRDAGNRLDPNNPEMLCKY
uniref:Reverse transcriptase/retrotransposon-derived protein RNase H-like domain-containing protein n=1 Tax=Strigamia maritima TaxID=126957 RepID=T1JIN3_STRMM